MRRRGVAYCRSLPCMIAVVSMLATAPTVRAHRQGPTEEINTGLAIPAITHGEMLVVARYRARILDLAARQPRTDPTLRRLAGFVSMQHFACFWGLVPGSLTDEGSPFNECAHAYVAAARALLSHMVAMPGEQSLAKGLDGRMQAELASDPDAGQLCTNSSETFSGRIIWPNWQLVPTHLPTVLTLLAVMLAILAPLLFARRSRKATARSPAHADMKSGLTS
jgi:hypothetical protein